MGKKIRLLDESTINKIAAGEVIENSASVVKELVQNSLDAGATAISIETKGAGRNLVRISDNGFGMSEDDALLSFERHATSKLSRFEDLASLATMGFRGEALPSIAAISHFSLYTSEGREGRFIKAEGGKLLFSKPIPFEKGTRIEVEQLFYNVPVRKRFLSSPENEEKKITKMVEALALACPFVQMTLIQNEKRIFGRPSESFEERVFGLYDDLFQNEKVSIDRRDGERRIKGILSTPAIHRGTRSQQHLFINGRPLHSPFLAKAILDGYGTLLPSGRFPLFFLHLQLPPEEIDINVHPQKTEVRFFREEEIRAFVIHAVAKALSKQRTPHPIEWAREMTSLHTSEPKSSWNWVQETPAPPSPESYTQASITEEPIELIGTVRGFILCQKETGTLLVIDQKRAHSRILYEEQSSEKVSSSPFSTPLIVPYSFHFDKEKTQKLLLLAPELQRAGLEIRPFGFSTLLIEAHPSGLTEDACRKLLENIAEGTLSSEKAKIERAALLSIPSTRLLTREEGSHLLQKLFQCKESELSPDGKPIFRKLPMRELFSS